MNGEQVFAGIDIGGTNVKFGLVNSEGKVLFRKQRQTLAEKGPTPLMHLLTNVGEELLLQAADDGFEIRHLGVGSPGAVDSVTGKVIGPCPNIAGWQGMEIGGILKERLNLPVFVDNDANSMALAESMFGAASGAKSVICMTMGTGIGGAVVLNGAIYHGSTYSAGEIGHMAVNIDGPRCNCGNNGCLEVYCSSRAILDRARSMLKSGLTDLFKDLLSNDLSNLSIRKFFMAYNKGDEVAAHVLDETSVYMGAALAGVVNLLNPDLVVIGGGVAESAGNFLDLLKEQIRKRAFDSAVDGLRVVAARLGNDAGFIGAGFLGEVEHNNRRVSENEKG